MRSGWLDLSMEAVSFLGEPAGLIPLILIASALLWRASRRWALLLPVLMAGTGVLQLAGKWAADRPRPNAAPWGFPSGHVLSLAVFFGIMAFLLVTLSERRRRWRVSACSRVRGRGRAGRGEPHLPRHALALRRDRRLHPGYRLPPDRHRRGPGPRPTRRAPPGRPGTRVAGRPARVTIPRADVVGSLLRPAYLREARQGAREGRVTRRSAARRRGPRRPRRHRAPGGGRARRDHRRRAAAPLLGRHDPAARGGRSPRAARRLSSSCPADPGWWSLWKEPDGRRAQVWTAPDAALRHPRRSRSCATWSPTSTRSSRPTRVRRTKFTIPSPSWHRIFWHPEYSRRRLPDPGGLPARRSPTTCASEVVAADHRPGRRLHPDGRAQLRPVARRSRTTAPPSRRGATTWRPSSWPTRRSTTRVFEGVRGVTRAIHICRGNAPGGRWLANGGYEPIAAQVFPRLTQLRPAAARVRHAARGRLRPAPPRRARRPPSCSGC